MASQRALSQRVSTRRGESQRIETQNNGTQRSQAINPEIYRKVNQYLLNHGCVLEETLLDATNTLLSKSNSPPLNNEELNQLVNGLNKKLRPYNFMIRTCMDEISLAKYFVLISTIDNLVTRAATLYNPKQLEFFKLILQAIVEEPAGRIPEEELRSLADKATLKKLSEYTSLFREWIVKHWFVVVTEGNPKVDYVTLGVRAIAELDVFIKQKLVERPEDLTCKSCNNMSIYSAFCTGCNSRYHKRCSKLALHEDSKLCRSCRRSTQ